MHASGFDIKTECPHFNKILICGNGIAEKGSICDKIISGPVKFKLSAWKASKNYKNSIDIKMEIKSYSNPELSHDSGIVKITGLDSNLCLESCCVDV
jgi:hypothetical protein